MKKKKLSLDALKVKSFVTSFDSGKSNTVRGGNDWEYSFYGTQCEPSPSNGLPCNVHEETDPEP